MLTTVFTVNTPVDTDVFNDTDSIVTLREAIFRADATPGADEIRFSTVPSDGLNGATITLEFGDLDIADAVTVDATMLSFGLTIDASGNDLTSADFDGTSVFSINVQFSSGSETKTVSLKNLTLTGGDSATSGGAISFQHQTFGDSEAILRVEDCVISNNSTGEYGGGVFILRGQLDLTRTVLVENFSNYGGGGVALREGVTSATIADSKFLRNDADDGGGLYMYLSLQNVQQTVAITDSLFADNHALGMDVVGDTYFGSGGGIYADLHGTATSTPTMSIINTTLDDNTAVRAGGGAFITSKYGALVEIADSTVSNNLVDSHPDPEFGVPQGEGGGLWLGNDQFQDGLITYNLNQVTISGNEADAEGGGVWIGHTFFSPSQLGRVDANLDFVTITNNHAPNGGGLFSEPDVADARISTTLNNTIVSGNTLITSLTTPNNVSGDVEDVSGFNLLGSGGGATLPTTASPRFNIHRDDHKLSPLADNGGPTLTHRPLLSSSPSLSSPAIDAGNPSVAFNSAEFDQRGPGFVRVFNQTSVTLTGRGPVDIGAYEVQLPKVIDVIVSSTTANQDYHPKYKFSTATYNGQSVIGSGNQLRTVPVAKVNSVEVRFSEDVPGIVSGDMTLVALALTGGQVPSLASIDPFDYDPDTLTATWKYSAALGANQYLISIGDALTDEAGNHLDGEWTNPFSLTTTNPGVSRFPSGDGQPGGAFGFVFTVLPGDATVDNVVASGDITRVTSNYTHNGTWTQGDLTGEGTVSSGDLSQVIANFTKRLQVLVYADADGDRDVDDDDHDLWSANFGTGTTHAQGDFDGNGLVDGADELIWIQQFGLQIRWV